ncbi:MAG: aminopeptidase P family protein [Selenomonadaceae bacterium]|nr:aminopeptidase P family protein [Selenomonadaceae bacterium]
MSRLARLLSLLDEKELDGVLVSKPVNVRYFSGFTGDSTILIVDRQHKLLITDGRYDDQARVESPQFEIVKHEDGLIAMAADRLKAIGLTTVGFEGNVMTFDQHAKLRELLPDCKFASVDLNPLRQIKDGGEIELIKRACSIADRAFDEVLNHIRAGVREIDIAAELEHQMRRLGSERPAFETIVASGINGSYPHARASEKLIVDGEFVTMDFGAVFKGYHSDITRTVMVGRANDEQRRLYDAVLDAQLHGLREIRVGASGKSVDKKVRDVLSTHGLEKYFTHGLGHGVGLEIHEEPRLSKLSKCAALAAGMVVTDEPGIYITDVGGLRIEDTVLVTEDEAQPLTHSSKHLIELSPKF